MTPLKRNLLFAALALLPAAGALAGPHGGHHGGHGPALSLHFGLPLGWYEPYYYYPPPYYYPPAVVQAPAPQAYVQRSDPSEEAQPAWYYCEQSRRYYPYVKACPGGWKRVSPTPPPQ